MKKLALLLCLLAGSAHAVCPDIPTDCPYPSYRGIRVGNTTGTAGGVGDVNISGLFKINGVPLSTGGTLTGVGIASANGFAGSSSGGTTPLLTLSTTIVGALKGNGSAISQAAASDLSNGVTGSGSVVLGTAPTIASPVLTGTMSGAAVTALLNNTTLTGTPVVPTASPGTNTTQVASTAFVTAAVSAATAGVASFNGRTGTVTLTSGDVTTALTYTPAPTASPTFTGTVTIPGGASITGYATLASPALSGVPVAPTASPGTNTTQIATTAFTTAAVAVETSRATTAEALLAPKASPTFTGTVTIPGGASISGYATLASPTFTGTPAAPTAAAGTNTTQLATTAFVIANSPRTILSGALTLYVDPALGVNSSTCGTSTGSSACLTIQKAVDNAYANYDTRGFSITIQLADSTSYAAGAAVEGRLTGNGSLVIQGNNGSPANVRIDGAGANTCFSATKYGSVQLQGFKVQNCAILISSVDAHAYTYVQNVIFGSCSTAGGIQMWVSRLSYMEILSAYQIDAATNCAYHIEVSHQGNFRVSQLNTGNTVATINANIAYSGSFVYASSLGDITFTGFSNGPYALAGHTVTGQSWVIDSGGMIQTLVAQSTFFPNTVVGYLHGSGTFNGPLHQGTTLTGGGASPNHTGDDYDGIVNEDAGSTGVTLTFGGGGTGAFESTPVCVVTYLTAVTNPTYAVASTVLITSHTAGSVGFHYRCHGG